MVKNVGSDLMWPPTMKCIHAWHSCLRFLLLPSCTAPNTAFPLLFLLTTGTIASNALARLFCCCCCFPLGITLSRSERPRQAMRKTGKMHMTARSLRCERTRRQQTDAQQLIYMKQKESELSFLSRAVRDVPGTVCLVLLCLVLSVGVAFWMVKCWVSIRGTTRGGAGGGGGGVKHAFQFGEQILFITKTLITIWADLRWCWMARSIKHGLLLAFQEKLC